MKRIFPIYKPRKRGQGYNEKPYKSLCIPWHILTKEHHTYCQHELRCINTNRQGIGAKPVATISFKVIEKSGDMVNRCKQKRTKCKQKHHSNSHTEYLLFCHLTPLLFLLFSTFYQWE